jgi:hypothetical protein
MVHGIEVGGDQIDRTRQAQASDILLQEANVQVRTVSDRYPKHLRRAINAKDRDTPTLAQVASKESGAAADVGRGAKSYIVPPDQCLEGSSSPNEIPNPKGDIIRRRQLAVRPNHTMYRA